MKPTYRSILAPLAALGLAAGLAFVARADGPKPIEVTVADLTDAGVAGATAQAPVADRFAPPMRYFRSPEKIPEALAKRDCADCGDLIGVYAAEVGTIPNWTQSKQEQLTTVGARIQVRAFIPSKKRVITVTAPSEATARKISAYLVKKFSQ